jgi:DNA-binding transcriptional LysR family regulator
VKPAQEREPEASGPFVLGAVPGATPGKWIDAWNERMPRSPLQLRAIAVDAQRDELMEGGLDVAIVRLPLDRDGLHVITLYDEVAVAVVPADSHLTVEGELHLADLDGETLIVPADDVLGAALPAAGRPAAFDPPETTADAVALVATGIGIAIMPMSLARLHARRDVAAVPLRDGPISTVALAWVAERATPAVDAFVGIVRGRGPRSSRG